MGAAVLRGISAGLLVTVLTLLGGMLWTAMGIGGVSAATIVDIGIFLSCMVGGYRTGKESRVWALGAVTGAAYVAVGALIMALFLPLRAAGVLQVVIEGGVLGLIAGTIGAGGGARLATRGMRGTRGSKGFGGFSPAASAYYGEVDRGRWGSWGWEHEEASGSMDSPVVGQGFSETELEWDNEGGKGAKGDPEQKDRLKVQEWVPEGEQLAWEEQKVEGYTRKGPWWEEEVYKG